MLMIFFHMEAVETCVGKINEKGELPEKRPGFIRGFQILVLFEYR